MSVPQSRLLDLLKVLLLSSLVLHCLYVHPEPSYLTLSQVQCRVFSSTYNPLRLRTGNRVLRQRLRGPSVAAYYPRRVATIKDLQKAYKGFDEELETWDDFEEDRLEHLALAKQRGKGAPKKKRSAEGMCSCLFHL